MIAWRSTATILIVLTGTIASGWRHEVNSPTSSGEDVSCVTFIGYLGRDHGIDVNGNGACTDREQSIAQLSLPHRIAQALLNLYGTPLCIVVDVDGDRAPFLGYSSSGEFLGLFHDISDLPIDGSVARTGLNRDGDCDDRESPDDELTELEYFAIGDSIASGHGLMDDGSPCRRSQAAYPFVLHDLLMQSFDVVHFPATHFVACTGSSAADDSEERSLDVQVDSVILQLDETPTLVTITIGANDFQWSNLGNFAYRLYWQNHGDFVSWLDRVGDAVYEELFDAVQRLLAFENAYIVLTEYYNPFDTDSVFFLSPVPGLCAFRDCYGRTEEGVAKLNEVLARVVSEIGINDRLTMTSGLHEVFQAHRAPRPMCGNDGPPTSQTWIQYRTDPNSNSFPSIVNWYGDRYGNWQGDCFHPNAEGAEQYARFIYQAIDAFNIN